MKENNINTLKESIKLNFPHQIKNNKIFKNSYNHLKNAQVIILSIINSNLTLFEPVQASKYLTPFQISFINEAKGKYSNYILPLFENLTDTSDNLEEFSFIQNNQNNSFNNNNNLDIFKKISKYFTPNLLDENPKLLNKKIERNKKGKIYYIKKYPKFSDSRKEYVEEGEKNDPTGKNLFQLSEKTLNHFKYSLNKRQKAAGRKKKNSGETGSHNKFSKDNIMRKLKNKSIESARKLINKKIKDESNSGVRLYQEISKIEGIYSQELNIKYNFWFYFQKLKDIFQFQMSSKYSRGGLDSNNKLINKIYSYQKYEKFPKTIKLLEMPFYQFYHDIFLDENKNWIKAFDIKENENKYNINYFVNGYNLGSDSDFDKYKNTIFDLAYNYEKYFLAKYPRIHTNKKSQRINNVKEIIKYLDNINDNQMYKKKFIEQACLYRPELKSFFSTIKQDELNINEDNFIKSQDNILKNYQNEIKNNNKKIKNEKKIFLFCNIKIE